MTNNNAKYAVRFVSQTEIEGYLALWGTATQRDCWNTWFDKSHPPRLGLEYLPAPLFIEHGLDEKIRKVDVGKVTHAWIDNEGIKFRATLYPNTSLYPLISQNIRLGKYGVSTGTADYLSEFDSEGRFKTWFVFDVSLTESPCEHRMPKVFFTEEKVASANPTRLDQTAAKGKLSYRLGIPPTKSSSPCSCQISNQGDKRQMATLQELGVPEGTDIANLLAALVESEGWDAIMQLLQSMQQPADQSMMDATGAATTPPPNAYSALMQELLKMKANQSAAETKSPAARTDTEMDAVRAQLTELKNMLLQPPSNGNEASQANGKPGNRTPDIRNMNDARYDHLSSEDMLFGFSILKAAGKTPDLDSPYTRIMAIKTSEQMEKAPLRNSLPFRRALPIRANEIMQSTLVGFGDEWVSVAYSGNLWEAARANVIYQELISREMMELEVPQGAESIVVPTEGSDPVWYKASQAANNTAGINDATANASQVGTGNVTLTPGMAKARIDFSDELAEDSIVAMLPQLNSQMNMSAQEMLENIIFNGDTATGASVNINLIDGTPAAGLSAPVYLVTDGILKLALVTNTAVSRDAGASLDEIDYQNTLKLLPKALRQRKKNLLFVVESDTYIASLNIAALKTKDVNTAATIEGGELSRIWGIDVVESGQIALANAAGKLSATPSNNTKGRLALVYAPYWAIGWKRRITIEVDKNIISGVTNIVASVRVGLKARSTTAAAVTYNVPV